MKKQQGLTLIEIIIALALGLFIIAATLSVYIGTIKSSSDTIKSARLNHDLDLAMNLMVEDLRRAGYWGIANINNPNGFANPFATTATTALIGNAVTTNDCIRYTYDADYDGVLDTDEYYGFRLYLNTTTNTHTIQIRSSNVACNDTTAAWQSITDENTLDVIDLQFSFAAMPAQAAAAPLPAYPALNATSRCFNYANNNVSATVTNAGLCTTFTTINATAAVNPPASNSKIGQKRVVNIRLTGRLVNDTDVVKSLSSSVKLANDRLYRQP